MTQKRVAIVVLVLVTLVLTVCARYAPRAFQALGDYRRVGQDIAEGRRFPQELAAAKAQGLPTRMADLQKPLPPPARNAASVYTRLTLLLKARPLSASENATMTLHPGVTPSATQWAQIAHLLHERAGAMALVHQAAVRQECIFARDWTKGDPAEISFPELATVRQSARLLELESLLMAHQGKLMEAARNQALGFQVARHGASDGTLLSFMVGMAVDGITLEGFKRIMTLAGPDVALDKTVESLLARDWKPRSLSAAVRTEMAFDLGMLSYLRKSGPQGLDDADGNGRSAPGRQGIAPGNWDALLDYNGVFLLDQMGRAIRAADGPYADATPVMNQVEAQATDKRHPARMLATILVPALGSVVGKRAQMQALADVTRTGAAVLARSARERHPPDHLVSAPRDPYTGKPIGYRREGMQGFVVYSAGADGHFDGGKPGEYSWKPYQVAFRYPAVSPIGGRR